ncbi:hypothetical protein PCNPT3_11715 [Psychromonas sp. CNPT3]|uniref:GNAT family N-acetyltransferase n=1 Tax=Psychromonas sp. CNPT3 TaxID=314282 RepID=UPI0002C06002|nr:GNAT family N-acetyltransferase [Psychromonas sp. CNPT3]AGH82279.1 hypothetical protein PCNPT3_11715 [Psychromonas sp. CNPT3]
MFCKIFLLLKEEGIRGLFKRVFNKTLQVYYLYEIKLTDEMELEHEKEFLSLSLEVLTAVCDADINEITKEKLDILKKRLDLKGVQDYFFLESTFIAGHYGLAFENNQDNPYINKYLKIKKGESYLFDDYTLARYRGKGFHKKSILSRLEMSRKKGCDKSFVIIYSINQASQKSYEKLGFIYQRKLYEIKPFKIILYGNK